MKQSSSRTLLAAKTIIEEFERRGGAVNPIKLFKMVYLFQGWTLAVAGHDPLNEAPQMGFYGPTYPELFKRLRKYGNHNLSSDLTSADLASRAAPFDEYETAILDQVVGIYGGYEPFQLSMLVRAEGTPWWDINEASGITGSIPVERIQAYFQSLSKSDAAA